MDFKNKCKIYCRRLKMIHFNRNKNKNILINIYLLKGSAFFVNFYKVKLKYNIHLMSAPEGNS